MAFGDGALWVGSPAPASCGRSIRARTGSCGGWLHGDVLRRRRRRLRLGRHQSGRGDLEARPGRATPTSMKLPAAIQTLTRRAHSGRRSAKPGVVVRVDPVTSARRTYRLGHRVSSADVHGGLVAVGVRPSPGTSPPASRAESSGSRSRAARSPGAALRSDPALYSPWDVPQQQFHYATCARLTAMPMLRASGVAWSCPRWRPPCRGSRTRAAPTPFASATGTDSRLRRASR